MAVQSLDTLKGYFKAGKFPTQQNYEDLIDTLSSLGGGGGNIVTINCGCDGDLLAGDFVGNPYNIYTTSGGSVTNPKAPVPIDKLIEAYNNKGGDQIDSDTKAIVIINQEWWYGWSSYDESLVVGYNNGNDSIEVPLGEIAVFFNTSYDYQYPSGYWIPINPANGLKQVDLTTYQSHKNGEIVQHVGSTTSNYTNGYIYKYDVLYVASKYFYLSSSDDLVSQYNRTSGTYYSTPYTTDTDYDGNNYKDTSSYYFDIQPGSGSYIGPWEDSFGEVYEFRTQNGDVLHVMGSNGVYVADSGYSHNDSGIDYHLWLPVSMQTTSTPIYGWKRINVQPQPDSGVSNGLKQIDLTTYRNYQNDEIVQHIGNTTSKYTNGYIYKRNMVIPVGRNYFYLSSDDSIVSDYNKTSGTYYSTLKETYIDSDGHYYRNTSSYFFDLGSGSGSYQGPWNYSSFGPVYEFRTLNGDVLHILKYNNTYFANTGYSYKYGSTNKDYYKWLPVAMQTVSTPVYDWVRIDVQPAGLRTYYKEITSDANFTTLFGDYVGKGENFIGIVVNNDQVSTHTVTYDGIQFESYPTTNTIRAIYQEPLIFMYKDIYDRSMNGEGNVTLISPKNDNEIIGISTEGTITEESISSFIYGGNYVPQVGGGYFDDKVTRPRTITIFNPRTNDVTIKYYVSGDTNAKSAVLGSGHAIQFLLTPGSHQEGSSNNTMYGSAYIVDAGIQN
jgi:hypothetical protein